MIAAAALAVVLAQASPAPDSKAHAPVSAPPAPGTVRPLAGIDRTFAVAALQGHAAEMAMARLALARSDVGEVRAYAQKMLDEHALVAHDVEPTARHLLGANAAAPGLAPADALALAHLQSLSGEAFDRAYAEQQVGDHLAASTVFATEADDGIDPRAKQAARTWLPAIQAHLQLAVQMAHHVDVGGPLH